ncbi:MAG TPA: ribosome small subunit-dependent GTPase A [Candidatus Portnoybacteria bacterium]|nr:ribosome small subunit-dependent GTPase A [Candidatus Portnoybacteria bacterium]
MDEADIKTKLEDLGYNAFFESSRQKLGLGDFSVGRVMVEYRGAYKVRSAKGESLARITGKQMFEALSREDYPAVGDWVALNELNEGQAVIRGVLPRKTCIKKRYGGKNETQETQIIATNVDVAFVVESVGRDYNLNRFERYFSIATAGGIKPAIILNKVDLITKEDLALKIDEIKKRFNDIDFIFTSTITNEGLDELKVYIKKGKTYCFLGSSGVGKSTLINKLLGENIIRTEQISASVNRGKHVTTSREMYFLENGGIVIDNPGMREVGMADSSAGIDKLFDEITILAEKCKFADCTHIQEPGCEVLAALAGGKLDADKYSNYINLKKEAEYYELTKLEKREKDRQFGKFIKKAKEQIKKYKQR